MTAMHMYWTVLVASGQQKLSSKVPIGFRDGVHSEYGASDSSVRMEQRAVVRFFTLKTLSAKGITAEWERVNGRETSVTASAERRFETSICIWIMHLLTMIDGGDKRLPEPKPEGLGLRLVLQIVHPATSSCFVSLSARWHGSQGALRKTLFPPNLRKNAKGGPYRC
jgi:hypothetical protein